MFTSPGRVFVSAVVALVLVFAGVAQAIPSPINHTHTAATVSWKEPGSPALPWNDATANAWNHQHLTADPFNNGPKWVINKAWDNRTLHNSLTGPAQFGHGLIEPSTPVRYTFAAGVPTSAKDTVEAGYNAWIAAATVQFNAKKDATDILAINFQRQNTGAAELTINFNAVQNTDGYGVFDGVSTIKFVAAPTITLTAPAGGTKRISIGNPGNGNAGNTSLTEQTPWEYNGVPAVDHNDDLWYSADSGATWSDTAPGGYGNLGWNFGSLPASDTIDIFEMDFNTIALHELGHSIALGHTGDGSGNIMEDDIANLAHFGRTKGIDGDSALAVAIDYTYSLVPEPASASLCLLMIVAMKRRRR